MINTTQQLNPLSSSSITAGTTSKAAMNNNLLNTDIVDQVQFSGINKSALKFSGISELPELTSALKSNQWTKAQRLVVGIDAVDLDTPLYIGSPCTALDEMIKAKNHKAVNFLLMHGAELGKFEAPSKELLSELAAKGADYPGLLKPALIYAAEENLEEMTDVLLYGNQNIDLNEKGSDGETPLLAALSMRNNSIIQKLLSFQNPVTGQKLVPNLEVKAPKGWNPQFKNSPTPLIMAVMQGNVEATNWLIEAGAQVSALDSNGLSALAHAVQESDEKNAKVLLAAGANPKETIKDNIPMLTYAVTKNNPEMVRLLIDAGAGINEPYYGDSGKTALMVAAEKGYTKIASLLIENTKLVDAQDELGRTALHYALENKQPSIVANLIQAGADPSLQDKKGLRPWDVAIEQGPSMINVLAEPEKFATA